jgi:type I restriction enzyme S subunit
MRSELPANWVSAPLGILGKWCGGGTPSKERPEFWRDGTIPWVSPKDMKVSHIRTTEDFITKDAIKNSATQLVPEGTVLIVTRSGILAHSLPVAISEVPVTLNQDLKAILPFDGIAAEYIASALDAFSQEILHSCSKDGTTVQSIDTKKLQDFEIPIAPYRTQLRIVDSLKSYFSNLDSVVATLDLVRRNLGRYRASVLKAAVEGRLVPTEAELARKERRSFEPASVLLQRILAERKKRWESAGKKGKYQEPEPPDTSNLPDLPEGWCWASPGQVFSWSSGKFLPQQKQSGGDYPVYGGNGINGYHDKPLITEPSLVVGRVGAHCGNLSVTEGPSWITDNAIYSTCVCPEVNLPFWQFALSTKNLNAAAGGTGQPYVNQKHLNNLVVPVPPTNEQTRVSDEVGELLSRSDVIETLVDNCLRRCSRLRQSILKAAFEGKLVEQDPSDEPVAVLLERIKSTRQRNGNAQPTRVKRRR